MSCVYVLCIFVTIFYTVVTDEVPKDFDRSSLPKLSQIDDYYECLEEPNGIYYSVDFDLKEDGTSLYEYIKNYSSQSFIHYDYRKLHKGICGSRCQNQTLTAKNISDVELCINGSIYNEYGLQIENITSNYNKTQYNEPLDELDYIVGVATIIIIAINIGCSLYLLSPDEKKGNKILLAFSIQKNWNQLKHGSNSNIHFKCLQGLRVYTNLLILILQTVIFLGIGGYNNAEYIEDIFNNGFKVNVTNIRITFQTFFVIGGFLMTYKLLIYAETNDLNLKALTKIVIYRCLRYMPAMTVIMLLTMTWIPRLGSGVIWEAMVTKEREVCRKNYWQLLILFQNFFPYKETCLSQTWFLAVDFQIFQTTLIYLPIIWKWPKYTVSVLSVTLVISILGVFIQSFYFDLLPIRVAITPESIRSQFDENQTLYYGHWSSQGNLAGYHIGVITAYIYYTAQIKKWDMKNSMILKIIFILSVPVILASIPIGVDLHYRKFSIIEASIFNSLNQNIFAVAIAGFILGCLYKCHNFYVNCVEWAPLQPLGRLSYSALLVHTIVLRTFFGSNTFIATDYSFVTLIFGVSFMTYILSVPLYLLVEAPCYNIHKLFLDFDRRTESNEKKNSNISIACTETIISNL